MVSDFATKYGILILEYLWIPIIVPILALLAKFVFSDKLGQFTRNYTQTTKRVLLTTNKG